MVPIQRCLWLCRGKVAARHSLCERAALRRGAHQVEDPTFVRFTPGPFARIDEGTPATSGVALENASHATQMLARLALYGDVYVSLVVANYFDRTRAEGFALLPPLVDDLVGTRLVSVFLVPIEFSYHFVRSWPVLPCGTTYARARTHVHIRCGSCETPITSRRY